VPSKKEKKEENNNNNNNNKQKFYMSYILILPEKYFSCFDLKL
jgi:hypothetical protein